MYTNWRGVFFPISYLTRKAFSEKEATIYSAGKEILNNHLSLLNIPGYISK